ncbi:MAG: hypothetical protein ABIH26_10170 [Candidatus Eisenbacteria bacterium]
MKRVPWRFGLVLSPILVLIPLLLMGFGCGGDDDNPGGPSGGDVPAAWVGLWSQSIVMKDCETHDVVFTASDTSAICPDEEDYEGVDDSVGVDCDYSWSGSQMTVNCTFYDTLPGPCYVETAVSYTGTVSGTSYNLSGTVETSFSGTCSFGEDSCMEIEISGQRIGDAPDPCDPFTDYTGGNGGGPTNGHDGMSVDITGGGSTVDYDVADDAVWVVRNPATDEYVIGSTLTMGTVDYSLVFAVPAADGPDLELSASGIEGKVNVTFTMLSTAAAASLQDIQQGTFTVDAYDSEEITGTFSFSGGVQDLVGGSTETYTFQSGVFDLAVDGSSGKVKTLPMSTPEQILAHVRRTIF